MNDNDLQHLAAIVRDSDDAIIGKTLEGIITSWNGGAERIYGYTAEEAIGRPVAMLMPPDREDELPEIFQNLTQGEGINHYDTLRVTKDGGLVNISLTVSPIRDASGVIIGASSIGRDVTKEKEAEAALRESARAYKLLMEQASDAILVSYPDQPLIEVNQRAIDMLGYTREELLQLCAEGRALPECLSAFPLRADEFLEGDTVYAERRVRRKDGTVIVVELSTKRLDDGRIVTIARDITDRKRAEEALRASEEKFHSIFENTREAMLITDNEGRFVDVNPAASKLIGLSVEELAGRHYAEFQNWKSATELGRLQDQVVERGEARGDFQFVGVNGDIIEVEYFSKANFIPGYHLLVAHDLTERRRTEEARMARDAAERANHAKSEFLSRMSHELRTPLNAILGFGQLLQTDTITPEQRESVDYIIKAGQHLLRLINEVLDIARIEEGKLTISIEPVFVRGVLQESLDLVQPLAACRNIEVKADLSGLDNCHVMADHQRLQQVLLNLLANAIKYNRGGGVVIVSCSQLSYGADGAQPPQPRQDPQPPQSPARVRIAVSDTGSGLSPDKVARLFTPFERLGAEQGDVEGAGLGLALSKHLVEAMGGAIGVESEQGVGSTFWVELSAADEQMPRLELSVTRPLFNIELGEQARTMLYIEDNLSNLRLIERILRKRPGINLITAMQGQMGLDLAYEHRPDLILLDLHLPDMPGIEVLRRLQENPRTASIPVVVLSADANLRRVDKLLEAGARAYLTKPFDVEQLLKVIEEIAAQSVPR